MLLKNAFAPGCIRAPSGSAGFQTRCVADFQIGSQQNSNTVALSRFEDLEIRDTADLKVGATVRSQMQPLVP